MDIETIFAIGAPLLFLVIGLLAGQITEVRHFARLQQREQETRGVILTNIRHDALRRPVLEVKLVTGHVVISTDYFKSVCASLRRLVGGHIRSYEKLVERGRREALLRLKDHAIAHGADLVLNVRVETMTIARSNQGNGVTGVEVLAYGTAIKTAG